MVGVQLTRLSHPLLREKAKTVVSKQNRSTPSPSVEQELAEDPAATQFVPKTSFVLPESQLGSNDDMLDPTADPTVSEGEEDAPAIPEGLAGAGLSLQQLAYVGKIMGDAVAAGIAKNQPKRKKTFGEYDPKTAFQPDRRKTLKLNRPAFQNGAWINPVNLFNHEIDALNKITHSGRYIDRLVEVVLVANGADDEVHLRYNNKTMAQRLENKGKWRDLGDMLAQILVAQAAERLEDEIHGQNRARMSARR
jgi:hypothetical protein